MLLSAVSVLVVAQSSSEIPEGLMNNPVHCLWKTVQKQRQAYLKAFRIWLHYHTLTHTHAHIYFVTLKS
jgi:hypothetical protein